MNKYLFLNILLLPIFTNYASLGFISDITDKSSEAEIYLIISNKLASDIKISHLGEIKAGEMGSFKFSSSGKAGQDSKKTFMLRDAKTSNSLGQLDVKLGHGGIVGTSLSAMLSVVSDVYISILGDEIKHGKSTEYTPYINPELIKFTILVTLQGVDLAQSSIKIKGFK